MLIFLTIYLLKIEICVNCVEFNLQLISKSDDISSIQLTAAMYMVQLDFSYISSMEYKRINDRLRMDNALLTISKIQDALLILVHLHLLQNVDSNTENVFEISSFEL